MCFPNFGLEFLKTKISRSENIWSTNLKWEKSIAEASQPSDKLVIFFFDFN